MILSADFEFSQSALQGYVDCPRLFDLRYVRRVRWPAVETRRALENERYMKQGRAFHRLIRQHLMGVPTELLSRTVKDPELERWWHHYVEMGPAMPAERYPEIMLTTPLGAYRLVARYDLIAVDSANRIVIIDWKTNRIRPDRLWLAERLQTKVYPYVLIRAGGWLAGARRVDPSSVSMVYWFANFASGPIQFSLDEPQYREDERYLLDLTTKVAEALSRCCGGDLLPQTEDRRRCRICRYRSLCERGVEAGEAGEREEWLTSEDGFDFTLYFDQIAELEVA